MPITFTQGDPDLAQTAVLAFGYNERGKSEVTPFITQLQHRFPAAFATYKRLCNDDKIRAGEYWIWRESKPALMFMVVRQTSAGATRLRYVEAITMSLARDYRLELISSLTIAALCDPLQWSTVKPALERWFNRSSLPVLACEPR